MTMLRTFLVLSFFAVNLSAQPRETEPPTMKLKVGALLPLSGDITWFGDGVQKGIQMALSEMKDPHIEVIFEDDQSLNKKAIITGAKHLTEFRQAKVLLLTAVNSAATVAPMLAQIKIPALIIWDSNKSINKMNDYVFGFGFVNELAGEDMANFAYTSKGSRKIGIISAHDEWSEIISEAFRERFLTLGGELVYENKVKLDDTDFKTIVARLKASHADSVYFPIYMGSVIAFVKQARELGFAGNMYTGDGFSENEVAQLGKLAEGIYVTQILTNNESFITKFKNFFPDENVGTNVGFAALGYDAVNFINDAARKNLSKHPATTTGEELRTAIANHSFNGILGQTHFRDSRLADRREKIVQVQGGKFVIVQ